MSSNVIYNSNKRQTSEASAEPLTSTPIPGTPKMSKLEPEVAHIIENTEQFSEASQPVSQHTEYSPADPVTRPQSPQPCSQPQDQRSGLQMDSKTSRDSVESATSSKLKRSKQEASTIETTESESHVTKEVDSQSDVIFHLKGPK